MSAWYMTHSSCFEESARCDYDGVKIHRQRSTRTTTSSRRRQRLALLFGRRTQPVRSWRDKWNPATSTLPNGRFQFLLTAESDHCRLLWSAEKNPRQAAGFPPARRSRYMVRKLEREKPCHE